MVSRPPHEIMPHCETYYLCFSSQDGRGNQATMPQPLMEESFGMPCEGGWGCCLADDGCHQPCRSSTRGRKKESPFRPSRCCDRPFFQAGEAFQRIWMFALQAIFLSSNNLMLSDMVKNVNTSDKNCFLTPPTSTAGWSARYWYMWTHQVKIRN